MNHLFTVVLLTISTTLFSLWNTNEGAKSRSKYTMNKHKESVGRVCCISDGTDLSHYSFSIHWSFEMDGKNCIKRITTNAIASLCHDTTMYLEQNKKNLLNYSHSMSNKPHFGNYILFMFILKQNKVMKAKIFQALDQCWLHPFFNRGFQMTTLTWDLKANNRGWKMNLKRLQHHSFVYFYTEISLMSRICLLEQSLLHYMPIMTVQTLVKAVFVFIFPKFASL